MQSMHASWGIDKQEKFNFNLFERFKIYFNDILHWILKVTNKLLMQNVSYLSKLLIIS